MAELTTGIPAAPAGSPFHALLQALTAESRLRLLTASRAMRISPGSTIVSAGDHVTDLAVVLSGTFRVESPDRHGLLSEVAFLEAGDYFGEMSYLRGNRANANVRATGEGSVLYVGHDLLAEIAASDVALTRELARTVAIRLSATSERFRAMRPGRAVGISAGGPWGHHAAWRVAESAAWHARSPILFIECHEVPPNATRAGAAELEALTDSASGVDGAFAALGRVRAPYLGVCDASRASAATVLRFAAEVQAYFALVIVCGEPFALGSLDGPFVFTDSDEPLAGPEGMVAVVLEQASMTSTPARRAALGATLGCHVTTVIGGSALAIEEPRDWPGAAEPWNSVDHLARRMLRRTVGLALGAGGAKGYAHIGVLRALRGLGVPIDYLAGCSIGGPLAAGIGIGMGPRQLKRELDMTFRRAMRPVLPFQSFLSSRRLIGEMERLAGGRGWDDLLIPLALVAVDIDTREEVVLTSGLAAESMAASMAIPGIFAPITLDGRRLVDGGILNPVPAATVAALGADIVIGVKLADPPRPGRRPKKRRLPTIGLPPIVDFITSAIDVMQWKITTDGSAAADVTIAPSFDAPVGLRDYRRGNEVLAAGEVAALAAAPELARLLPWIRTAVGSADA